MADTQSRREILVRELAKKSLSLRADSRLCSCYINDTLGEDWSVERVVGECALMHWLYLYTNYPCRCYEAYIYFSTVFTSGKSVHEFVKKNVQPHIKAQIILAHGGIPKVWPWVPEDSSESERDWTVVDEGDSEEF